MVQTKTLLERLRADLAGQYQVERELASGGMATVFVADDLRHHRRVAIKLLSPHLAAAIGPRFLQEIELAGRLTHPHILPLYDSGAAADSLFYVMPYIPEDSLRERLLREGQLPVEEALAIAREVADALAYAHANGVVHRDIKPGNILLSAGHAIVADFGVARAVSAAGAQALSSAGVVLGTPAYMSPEQASGHSDLLDGRSDIYSLGCVVYEMLAGTPPFTAATPQAMIARHFTDPVPPLQTVRAHLPEGLDETIARALAKAPADRYRTATAFAAALAGERAPRRVRARWAAVAAALVLGGAGVLGQFARTPAYSLDVQRIVVYPPAGGGREADDALFGEDVGAAAVAALNSTRRLRSHNGWRLLSSEQRAEPDLSAAVAGRRAREVGAGFYVDGRLIRGDSLHAIVELHDLRGDSSVHRTLTFPLSVDAWTMGVAIARDLLPALLGHGESVDLAALGSPNSAAAAAYLLGDRAYRRGHFRAASAYFRHAAESDSSFAMAAIMGAQAAGWGRLTDQARDLVGIALGHQAKLAPRYAHYLQGLSASWNGLADSAVLHLRTALALDPNWPEAWAELGEVFSHWLPAEPAPDSLQHDAFQRAYELDPAFIPALYHLVETSLRRGELAQAERHLAALDSAGADSFDRIAPALMVRCVAGSPRALDWEEEVRLHPADVRDVAGAMAVAGLRQPGCAEAAWRAILEHDGAGTEETLERRYAVLVGLHALLLAERRVAEARELLARETRVPRVRLWPLHVVATFAGGAGAEGSAAADSLARVAAAEGWSRNALWSLAVWEQRRDNPGVVGSLAERAEAAASRPGADRRDSLLARSLAAWTGLARRDTARALELLRTLTPTDGGEPWEHLGPERMLMAQLHFARQEYLQAFRVASLLDSPGSVSYVMHLPASLALRSRAARAMGDERLAAQMNRRLAALDRSARESR